MENFFYYANVPLYIVHFFIYARSMKRFPSAEDFRKRSFPDKFFSALLILAALSILVCSQLVSCASNKEAFSFYESKLFFSGLYFCFSGACLLASFFIAEKRLFVFDMLKYVARSWGGKILLFVSVWTLAWGLFTMIALLFFDFPAQKGRCFFGAP